MTVASSNDLPTAFQRSSNALPTGCVFHPPHTLPWALEGPARWKGGPTPAARASSSSIACRVRPRLRLSAPLSASAAAIAAPVRGRRRPERRLPRRRASPAAILRSLDPESLPARKAGPELPTLRRAPYPDLANSGEISRRFSGVVPGRAPACRPNPAPCTRDQTRALTRNPSASPHQNSVRLFVERRGALALAMLALAAAEAVGRRLGARASEPRPDSQKPAHGQPCPRCRPFLAIDERSATAVLAISISISIVRRKGRQFNRKGYGV